MAMNDLAENEFRAKYHVLEHINNEDLRDIFGTSLNCVMNNER